MRSLRPFAALALLLSLPLALPAQARGGGGRGGPVGPPNFPTSDPVLKRLWTLGMDSSEVWPLAQALLDSIGPRLHGSPLIKSGHDWLVARYQQWGIAAKNEAYGTWRGWRRGVTHVDLLKPRLRTLEAHAMSMSAPSKGEVTGGVAIFPDVPDASAFSAWLPRVRGKFVMLSNAQPTCRPNEEWQAMALPATFQRMDSLRSLADNAFNARFAKAGFAGTARVRDQALGAALTGAGAAGVLVGRWQRGWGVDVVSQTYIENIPTIDLSCEDYGLVFRLAERNQGPELRARVDAEFLGDVPVFNTIATIPGQRRDEYVMLSAHFDSWDGGSGATDNGTGTITMLEAMRLLKTVYPNPKRTIVVGHWAGEEWGLHGSHAWAFDHPEVVRGLFALFNQDNGTGRVQSVGGAGLLSSASHIGDWFARLPDRFMSQITLSFPGTPAGGGTDHASFDCHGAPGFGLSSLGWDYGVYTHHTNRDTFDKVVFDELKGNATLTAMLAYLASEDASPMGRERRIMPAGGGRGGRGGGAGAGPAQPQPWPACPAPVRSWADYIRP